MSDGGEYSPPQEFFRRLKVDTRLLEPFGFARKGSCWEYEEEIAGGSLVCRISIDRGGAVSEYVFDAATGDEYSQHRVAGASGKFVGRVRRDVASLMARIANGCFSRDVFKTASARGILAFAVSQWNEKPEFLWKNFPDYAVLRRKDTGKWYALVARLPAGKVGGSGKGAVEIVNLRRTEGMEGARFLPAYHMNKKTWATVVLDDGAGVAGLLPFVAASRGKAM